jgi:hypothetical protein
MINSKQKNTKQKPQKVPEQETEKEFGGPIGAACIIIFSHILPYYLWISNFYYNGQVIYPESL